jgi:UMF1 family MFS transporter
VKGILAKPKVINGWAMYDWANSVFTLTITSSIFPIFYENMTITTNASGEVISDMVVFFGVEIRNTTLYSWTFTIAFLLIAIFTPLLSGIADYSGKKKGFMKFFVFLGSISVSLLYFFDAENLELGMILLMLGAIGYSGSIVFYNAFLPEIAPLDMQDRVSAKGYALGYFGSIILLVFNLLMIMQPGWFFNVHEYARELGAGGISQIEALKQAFGHYKTLATRISFLSVGIWWMGFSLIPFRVLPENPFHQKPEGNYIYKGYLELLKVWKELRANEILKRFLMAYFVFNMGVQTVMYMAITFAKKEINNMPDEGLIISILIIQFIAIVGAYLFSYLSGRYGNLKALMLAVGFWILILIQAYNTYSASQFYLLAAAVGLVMGGIQALSRSTYSKLLPETIDHSSYFGFYDIADKIGVVLGTLVYGLIYQLTGSTRDSIIALAVFFVLGLIILFTVPRVNKSQAEVVQKT